MADRQTMMNALRNAHNAGDTEAATRIAGMIKNLPQEQPTVPQEAPQGATPTPTEPSLLDEAGDVLGGVGRITAGAVRGLANVGVGMGNAVLSAADYGAEKLGGNIDYRIPEAGYGSYDEALAPKGTYEQVGSQLGTAGLRLC